MTIEEWKESGFDTDDNPMLCLEAGMEWLEINTTIPIQEKTIEEVKALPNMAKLFLLEFCSIMQRESGLESESISGMSQSFQEKGKDLLIMKSAKILLSGYLKPTLTIHPARKRWF